MFVWCDPGQQRDLRFKGTFRQFGQKRQSSVVLYIAQSLGHLLDETDCQGTLESSNVKHVMVLNKFSLTSTNPHLGEELRWILAI